MASIQLPKQLPLLLIDGVLFPGSSMRIPITTFKNMSMVKNQLLNRSSITSTIIGVVPRENKTKDEEEDIIKGTASGIHKVGTAGIVIQVTGTNWPRPSYSVLVTGLCRFRVESVTETPTGLMGTVCQLDRLPGEDSALKEKNDEELSQLMAQFREQITKLIDMLELSGSSERVLNSLPIQSLPDVCASIIKASHDERLEILDAIDLTERFRKALPLLVRQIEALELLQKSRKDRNLSWPPTLNNINPNRVLQRGGISIMDDDFEDGDEIGKLEKKFREANLPEPAKKTVARELRRLKKLPPHAPEYSVTRNYVELLLDLPWNKTSQECVDLKKSQKDLDADHYGMTKLKKRVLEYLAVRQLKKDLKAPILCFVGPPGVGKTSVGRSIARSLGREFYRISLGGVCNQSEIRGHRRTYIGSMPGRIIQGLRMVGVKNPVFLLDEIDKMTPGVHGDPSAALLEVLDPEQNFSFTDHYVNAPFDLSQVLFIATANTVRTIPPALLDRMEVIHVPGYTHFEKEYIAQNHLIPKMLEAHGLTFDHLRFTEDAIRTIILRYTQEAGVRNLERKIGDICRDVAVNVVMKLNNSRAEEDEEELPSEEPSDLPIIIDSQAVLEILGTPIYDTEVGARLKEPGVAIGLVWSPVGGKVMFVEASKMEGTGHLTLTGQLGKVLKESATLALHWLRANAHRYGILSTSQKDILDGIDVHIHIPAGAVAKEGPSAGITLVTVLVSLFAGQPVRTDLAMTGEITLQGLVLPVGGIKEKVLAAHRYGLKQVIIPQKNEKDLAEIPESVKNEMTFHLVTHVDQALSLAFLDSSFLAGLDKEPSSTTFLQSKL